MLNQKNLLRHIFVMIKPHLTENPETTIIWTYVHQKSYTLRKRNSFQIHTIFVPNTLIVPKNIRVKRKVNKSV